MRNEVVGLFASDLEHISLPTFERRVVEQKLQHVALRPLGKSLCTFALVFNLFPLLSDVLRRVDEGIDIVL